MIGGESVHESSHPIAVPRLVGTPRTQESRSARQVSARLQAGETILLQGPGRINVVNSRGMWQALAMRLPRIKLEGDGGGHFHVMSRIAEGKFIFDPMNPGTSGAVAAEKFREMTCPH